ncbi:MAG TPA: hypothetical protein VFH51_18760 [Myxococcota bacterium]|nr:hypothetical protein [Myxococcota bacterium]
MSEHLSGSGSEASVNEVRKGPLGPALKQAIKHGQETAHALHAAALNAVLPLRRPPSTSAPASHRPA